MRGDAAGDVDAEGGDFGVLARPHASQPGDALRWDFEIGAGADEDFFEAANVFDDAERFAGCTVGGKSAQIEDGIGDELAGAVESNVAAAVALEDFNPALGKEFGRREDIFRFGIAAEGNDGRVLEKKNNVADAGFFAERDELFLQAERRGVIDGAELEDRDQKPGHGSSPISTDLNHFTTETQRHGEIIGFLRVDPRKSVACTSSINREPIHAIRGVQHGFGERGVGVDGPH